MAAPGPSDNGIRVDDEKKAYMQRIEKELSAVGSFLQVLQSHQNDIRRGRGGEANDASRGIIYRTTLEETLFHRWSYQNWTLGFIVGGGTFAALHALIAWRTKRSKISSSSMWSSRTTSVAPTRVSSPKSHSSYKVDYAALDGRATPVGKTFTGVPKGTSSSTHSPSQALEMGDDFVAPIQTMALGAISLFIAISIASATRDDAAFFRDLANLPLQPGRSTFLHRVCPDMIRTQESLTEIKGISETEELDALLRMVHHCRQRQALQDGLQEPVDVPEPGIKPAPLDVL